MKPHRDELGYWTSVGAAWLMIVPGVGGLTAASGGGAEMTVLLALAVGGLAAIIAGAAAGTPSSALTAWETVLLEVRVVVSIGAAFSAASLPGLPNYGWLLVGTVASLLTNWLLTVSRRGFSLLLLLAPIGLVTLAGPCLGRVFSWSALGYLQVEAWTVALTLVAAVIKGLRDRFRAQESTL